MKDVRELIQEAADSLGIPSECESFKSSGESEYIIYTVISNSDALYSDNKPHMSRIRVYLYYISTSQNNKLTRPKEIISAMAAKGFKIIERGIDVTSRRREDDFMDTGYSGIMQEYLLERFGNGK